MEPRVVVIDDERDVLELVREVLEDEGLQVEAINRPDRMGDLSRRRPDMVLMDLMLPGTNGIELAHKLRRSGLTEVPIVAMSASEVMLRMAGASGLFEELLPKPFDIADLLLAVDRHTSRAHAIA